MTPLMLQILLHYYARAHDFRDGDFSAPAVGAEIDGFLAAGLLEKGSPFPGCRYGITERGRAHIENLLAIPYPVQKWVPAGRD